MVQYLPIGGIAMSYLTEKAQYLKGLADGMKLDKETNEGKLFSAILEMLEDTALAMEEVVDIQDEMQEQLNEVDEDLADVEDEIYGEDEDDDFYDCDDEGIFMTCPKCGDDIYVEYDAISDDCTVVCPNCGEEIEIECDCDCEECGKEE